MSKSAIRKDCSSRAVAGWHTDDTDQTDLKGFWARNGIKNCVGAPGFDSHRVRSPPSICLFAIRVQNPFKSVQSVSSVCHPATAREEQSFLKVYFEIYTIDYQ